jgi:Gpi18-like mannosyltransferase
MQWFPSWLKIGLLVILFGVRCYLATTTYNPDIWNHEAWVESIEAHGWSGLYERDMGERAPVNYPPLSLYSFYLGEKLYQISVPSASQTDHLRAFFYKLPSLLADLMIALLIWRLLPLPTKWRPWVALAYLLNPSLAYNSVYWGQIESLSVLPAILTVLALLKKRGDLALIFFTLGCLTKQNILPLVPLILYGCYELRDAWRHLLFGGLVSLGLVLITYAPLLPPHASLLYIPQNYLQTIGGQAHQHLASVNALNFAYGLGLNNIPDSLVVGPLGLTLRTYSLVITSLITLLALWRLGKRGGSRTRRYLEGLVILTLGTFMFTSRMHERHGYMAIAYLTLLTPYFNVRGWASHLFLSILSFYNVYGVWAGYFWSPMGGGWESTMQQASLLAALISVILMIRPHWLLRK